MKRKKKREETQEEILMGRLDEEILKKIKQMGGRKKRIRLD